MIYVILLFGLATAAYWYWHFYVNQPSFTRADSEIVIDRPTRMVATARPVSEESVFEGPPSSVFLNTAVDYDATRTAKACNSDEDVQTAPIIYDNPTADVMTAMPIESEANTARAQSFESEANTARAQSFESDVDTARVNDLMTANAQISTAVAQHGITA